MKINAYLLSFILMLILVGSARADVEVSESCICRSIKDQSPLGAGNKFEPDVGKLFCFTRLEGMKAQVSIIHRWIHNERIAAEIQLKAGSSSRRIWSGKNIDPSLNGQWRVEIVDKTLNLILDALEFTIGEEPKGERRSAKGDDLEKVRGYLKSLSLSDPDSISKGLEYTKAMLDQVAPSTAADEIFLEFYSFYGGVVATFSNQIYENDSPSQEELMAIYDDGASDKTLQLSENGKKNRHSKELDELYKKLRRNGMFVDVTEDTFFVDESPDFVFLNLGEHLTQPLKDYMRLRTYEKRVRFSEDASLRISFSEVGGRALTWEKFKARYPDFSKMKVIDGHIELYMRTLLTGMDNSWIFDWETGKLNEEPRKAYEHIIANYPDSHVGRIISGYYDIIKRNDFTRTDELNAYLGKVEIVPMEAIQPPLR